MCTLLLLLLHQLHLRSQALDPRNWGPWPNPLCIHLCFLPRAPAAWLPGPRILTCLPGSGLLLSVKLGLLQMLRWNILLCVMLTSLMETPTPHFPPLSLSTLEVGRWALFPPCWGSACCRPGRNQVTLWPDSVCNHHLQLPSPLLSPQPAFLSHWCQSRWSLCWLNCPQNVLDAVYTPARSFWFCLTPWPQPLGSRWVRRASGFFTGSLEEPAVNTPWEQVWPRRDRKPGGTGRETACPFAVWWNVPDRIQCFHMVSLVCAKLLQSCPTLTLWTVVTPGSSFHGILQVRILEWVAISFSKRSSLPRIEA